VGAGRVHFVDSRTAQIRYMAVSGAYRGRGIGTQILQRLERIAWSQGVKRIVLNARESAVAFYEQQNYRPVGAGHTLYGVIKHVQMEKTATSPVKEPGEKDE
jgi:GNAT superfamily N-acetyltransferase